MDLLQLKYFMLLAREQHVSRTAEMLHISQPSLSSTIKKLENEIGCSLFEHKGRNIYISQYGKAFLSHVEKVFEELETGRLEIERLKTFDENELSLATLSPYIWQDMIHSFSVCYPEVNINQQSIEGYDFIEPLLSGEFDFYIGATNNLADERISFAPLYEDGMVILLSKEHPYACYPSIDLAQCKNEHFVMLPSDTSLQQFINYLCYQAGFSPIVSLICDYTIRDEMVAAGYGISITTLRSASHNSDSNTTYVPINQPNYKRQLSIVWSKGLPFSHSMELFFKSAIDFYKSYK